MFVWRTQAMYHWPIATLVLEDFLSTFQLIHPNLSSKLPSFLTQMLQDSGSGFQDRSAILCARGGIGWHMAYGKPFEEILCQWRGTVPSAQTPCSPGCWAGRRGRTACPRARGRGRPGPCWPCPRWPAPPVCWPSMLSVDDNWVWRYKLSAHPGHVAPEPGEVGLHPGPHPHCLLAAIILSDPQCLHEILK